MAIYTHITQNEIVEILDQFQLGALKKIEPIDAGITNSNYKIITENGDYKLTIYERYLDIDDVHFFVALFDNLQQNNIAAPRLIRKKDNTFLLQIQNKYALLYSYEQGLNINYSDCNTATLLAAGRALATLHTALHSLSYTRPNPTGTAFLQDIMDRAKAVKLPEKETQRLQIIDEFWRDHAAAHYQDLYKELPLGTIHGDYFIDNILRNEQTPDNLIILDFDYACFDILTYDIAIAINAWCFSADGQIFHDDYMAAFLHGYQTIRPLQDVEKDSFLYLALFAALRFTLSRLQDKFFPATTMQSGTPHPVTPFWNRFEFWLQKHKDYTS